MVNKRYNQGPIVEGNANEQLVTGEDMTQTEDWVGTGEEVYDEQDNGVVLSLERVQRALRKINYGREK